MSASLESGDDDEGKEDRCEGNGEVGDVWPIQDELLKFGEVFLPDYASTTEREMRFVWLTNGLPHIQPARQQFFFESDVTPLMKKFPQGVTKFSISARRPLLLQRSLLEYFLFRLPRPWDLRYLRHHRNVV